MTPKRPGAKPRGAGWTDFCEQCGKPVHRTPFQARTQKHVFCSRDCYHRSTLQQVERRCEHCGNTFSSKRSKMTEDRGKYCSQNCYDLARAERYTTFTCTQCGKPFKIMNGYTGPSGYRGKYCSIECSGIARRIPDSIRSEYNHEFTEELRESIRERDRRTCQLCGISETANGRLLDVHHIDYNKTNCHPSNLISLCKNCHPRTNYNRDYWMQRLLRVTD